MNPKNILKAAVVSITILAFTASASFAGCGCGKKSNRTSKSSVGLQRIVK